MVNLNISILKSLKGMKEASQNQREKEKESKLAKVQAKQEEIAALRKQDNRECLQFTHLRNIKSFSADFQRFLCKMLLYARMYSGSQSPPEE